MSRQTVRAAVATWFQPPAVPFLNACYRSEPKVIQGSEFFAGQPSGAVGFVYIESEQESRIGLGGEHSGKKLVRYNIGLVMTYRSVQPKAEDAMDDYDTLIEGIKVRLRSDRTLGTKASANPVLQAGESSTDIEVVSDLPRLVGEQFEVLAALRFQIDEVLTT